MEMIIPVIGVPIVNGVHWLEKLISSIDHPVNELFIVNNNGRGEIDRELDEICKKSYKYINRVRVVHLPANIGCSGSWNLIIKCYLMCPYWIISSHDVSFTPGLLTEIWEKMQNDENLIVKAGECQWDWFAIKEKVIQDCGLFDENFYPAYCEDCDYHIRLLNKGIHITNTDKKHIHGDGDYSTTGSQTWRTDLNLKDRLTYSNESNQYYIAEKWGYDVENIYFPWTSNPVYKFPYDNPTIPISYTSYDLKFIRRKYLGF